ncbi:MAG TPA: HDOD domain-containing protein [Noviherbaspirillum sp.]|uniref:EAL and HDOD domain-containing protein n=1 Tax=Noviherbaspirillum sp. TaxID=1926288 RepID=UPI002F94037C
MSVSITFNSAYRIPLASAFFMARHPVLDRSHRPVAHELLFGRVGNAGTSAGDEASDADSDDDAHGTGGTRAAPAGADRPAHAPVIEDVARHGLLRILGDLAGILHIDEEALLGDSVQQLPFNRVILELAPHVPLSDATVVRCAQLAAAGYRFGLRPAGMSGLDALLPLVQGIRIDVTGMDAETLRAACNHYRGQGKRMYAAGVETLARFQLCAELGFDYFQGYYFTAPQVLPGRRLSPSQQAIVELLSLLASDASDTAVEHRIKADVALGLNLLRLANTPACSTHRIDSLRQAVMVLGRNQLQRWLQVLLYADGGGQAASNLALSSLAAVRGRLMELVAQKLMPGNRSIADTAFTVGIMSLMDTLFGMPMDELLRQLPVGDEVQGALQCRQGYFGRLLTLAEHAERQHQPEMLLATLRGLRLSSRDFYLLQLAAYEWSDQVNRELR